MRWELLRSPVEPVVRAAQAVMVEKAEPDNLRAPEAPAELLALLRLVLLEVSLTAEILWEKILEQFITHILKARLR
jgi:hypothetical protein